MLICLLLTCIVSSLVSGHHQVMVMLLASDDQILQRLLVLHNVDQRTILHVASFLLDYWNDTGCGGPVDLTLLGYTWRL